MSSASEKRPACSGNYPEPDPKRLRMGPREEAMHNFVHQHGFFKSIQRFCGFYLQEMDEEATTIYQLCLAMVLKDLVSFCVKKYSMHGELDKALCDTKVCLQRLEALSATDFKHLAALFVESFGPNTTPSAAIVEFLTLDFFKIVKKAEPLTDEESFQATIGSWGEKYKGNAPSELLGYIRHHVKNAVAIESPPYFPILQSSGFPPPDDNVRDYLTSICDETAAMSRSIAFLEALLEHTYSWVCDHCTSTSTYEKVALSFREFMTRGQSVEGHGKERVSFYDAVIETSERHLNQLENTKTEKLPQPSGTNYSLADKAKAFVDALVRLAPGCESKPYAILAIDEAHVLSKFTRVSTINYRYTYLVCLRQGLRKMFSVDIFSLFLSTRVSAFQSAPPPPFVRGSNLQAGVLPLIRPFYDIGFDQLAEKVVENEKFIEQLARIDFLLTLGRPLWATRYKYGNANVRDFILGFAIEKLLNNVWTVKEKEELEHYKKLACLAVRLALDFHRHTRKELGYIDEHLRICMDIDPEIDNIKSIVASEPILAEAARMVMKESVNFAAAFTLQQELTRSNIERGARGEVVVQLLLLLASDASSTLGKPYKVVDFLDNLLHSESPSDSGVKIDSFKEALPSCVHPQSDHFKTKTLYVAFEKAVMTFSHFVKVDNYRCTNRKFLWRLMARGAGVICTHYQSGVETLLPYCYYDKTLGRDNVGVIEIQLTDDVQYGKTIQAHLFDAMDPYRIGVFDDECDELPDGPMPVIRIVAALASKENFIKDFQFDDIKNSNSKVKKTFVRSRQCTAYDLYIGGLHNVWKPIKPEEEEEFVDLLDISGSNVYKSSTESAECIRRSQAPGVGEHAARWSNWSRAVDEEKAN